MKIKIITPSKCIEPICIDSAVKKLEDLQFSVDISQHAKSQHDYFSGTKKERKQDFQEAINSDSDIIWCSRGGYGLIQYIDDLDFSSVKNKHKWLIGFSDITVAHLRLNQLGFESIHGAVPLNFDNVTEESLSSIFNVFNDEPNEYQFKTNSYNVEGEVNAEVVGGNLAIIYSLLGTNFLPDFNNKILFIEDVGEALYAIDRMMNALRLNGILDQISGLIVGGFTHVGDSNPKYGETYEQIISKYVDDKNIPVCFDFPAGHQEDNRAIVLGRKANLKVNQNGTTFYQA